MAETSEIIKYFTRKQYFPALATWSFKLQELYREYPTLRALIVEGIDLKESPTMNYQEMQKALYKTIGIDIKMTESSSESVAVSFDKSKMNVGSLTPTITNLVKKAVRTETITNPSSLNELAQINYFNKILKHRFMGFNAEVLVYDAYRHWDWAANIADLCNSLLPVFERLVKKEVYVFPFLDKDLQECSSACNSFLAFLQGQSQVLKTEDLSLEETDVYVGHMIKPSTPDNPDGGILTPVGSHLLLGDAMIETNAPTNNIMRLALPPEYEQPSWTVTKVYVRPGEKLSAGMKVITISALNIRAEQGRFFKLLQDVYRHLGRIREKALYLKDAIEEEMRGGVPSGEAEGATGFKPKARRFEALESPIPEEKVEETSQALGIEKSETGRMMKKIQRVKRRAKPGA